MQPPVASRAPDRRPVSRIRMPPSIRGRQPPTIAASFALTACLPGPYQMVVTAKGFADAKADVDTAVSSVRDTPVTLQPAAAMRR